MLRYSKFDEAEDLLSKAIKCDKGNYEAYYYRGCVRINMQRYKEAIADFEKAVELKCSYCSSAITFSRESFIK